MSFEFDKLLLEKSPDALIASTPEGNVLYWNQGAEQMFGYNAEEAVNHSLNDLVVPAERVEEEARIIREAIETGFSTHDSLRRRKDGSFVFVTVSTKAIRDEQGGLFILSTKKDVTQLKVLRDANLLEAQFGDLLELTPDAIVMVNATGRIVLANRQAEKIFGYARRELRGRLIDSLIPERFRKAHLGHRAGYFGQPHARAMGEGMELHGLRKDGTEFPVEITLSPLRTEEGTLVMSAIRDISERKQFERELQAKNSALEAANQELESFSYSISHDLRAPVRAMAGFARILKRKFATELPAEAGEALQRIQDNATKMGELIDGLLVFSQLSRQPIKKSTIAPDAIVKAVVEELRPEFAGRRVQIEVDELPPCEADPTLLQQVYMNLLSNAVKSEE